MHNVNFYNPINTKLLYGGNYLLDLQDVVTDLNAESEPLPLDEIKEDWLGHKVWE